MRYPISLLFLAIFVLSCKKETPKDKTSVVHTLSSPAGKGGKFPFLYSGPDATLMSWVAPEGDSLMHLKYAAWEGEAWGETKEIVRGTNWFVNWADFPAIAEQNGHLLSHILQKSSAGTYSYDVKLNILPKGESAWQTQRALHTDNTPTEHGFVTLIPYKENSFFVTWLDGRNTMQGGEHEHHGAMTIRAAEVTGTGEVLEEAQLDARTCDCCQTTAALTKTGPVVVYRDRSEDEIRDISIVRLVDGQWTTPKTLHNDNWKIQGCPVNGPKAAVLENTLAVAWFTAAGEIPKVKVIFSADGGEHFDAAITLSEGRTSGRVDIALLNHSTAVVSYIETEKDTARLVAVKVTRSGAISKPVVISEMDAARSSGFPQMELVNDKIFFAWTDVREEATDIGMAYIMVNDF